MERYLFAIDKLSMWTGKGFGWCILILTLATCYEVFMRYVIGEPTQWAFDMSIQMYGALIIMTGAYALSRDAHVRGDILYRLMSTRKQASMDLLLYILFFFPGMTAMIFYGYTYAADSWFYKEVQWSSPARIQIYYFKTLIPIAGLLLFIQGIAEVSRCIICIKTGEWPRRLHDVEETETMLMNEGEDREALAMGNMTGPAVEAANCAPAPQPDQSSDGKGDVK